MKAKLLLALLLLFVCTVVAFSQEDITKIDPVLTEKPWLDKEVKSINGYNIIQIFGERPSKYKHMNFGPTTSIAYNSLNDLLKELKVKATNENWSEERYQEEKKHLKEIAQGGAVDVFISRYEESSANFKWFFLIIRNEDDVKISEIQLGYQAPEMPEGSGWWNYKRVFLEKKTELPFFVYLNDKLSDHLSDFKFEVKRDPESGTRNP